MRQANLGARSPSALGRSWTWRGLKRPSFYRSDRAFWQYRWSMATVSETPYPAARDVLVAQLRELSADDFASRLVLDRVPWLFSDRRQYIDWKTSLALELELDPYMLLVVGSACLGFSLSPFKRFTEFGSRSDIDVAAVSERYFDEAWRWLRDLGPENLPERDELEQEMFRWHRRNLVFDGAIATEKLLPRLPFGDRWMSALGHAGNQEPTVGRKINVRIYRDFESLRKYHVTNIRNLKLELIAEEADTSPRSLPRMKEDDQEYRVEGEETVL